MAAIPLALGCHDAPPLPAQPEIIVDVCPLAAVCNNPVFPPECATGLLVKFQSDERWPIGRHFFRFRIDGLETTVCSIELGPVIGAVNDTCSGAETGMVAEIQYDEAAREIRLLYFASARDSIDLEVLSREDVPPLAEVHHTLTGGCSQQVTVQLASELRDAGAGVDDDAGVEARSDGGAAAPEVADAATPLDSGP